MKRGCGVVFVAAISLSYAMAAGAADSLVDLLACRDLSDATARLACFDREAGRLAPAAPKTTGNPVNAAPSPAPAVAPVSESVAQAPPPPPSVAPAPPPALDARQQFGLNEGAVEKQQIAAGTRAPKLSRIEAHIVRTAHSTDGHLIFTLDNDQAWRSLEAEDILVQPGEAVTISRALLGSYWLKMSSGRGCKVTRLH